MRSPLPDPRTAVRGLFDPLAATRQVLRDLTRQAFGADDPDPSARFRQPPGDPGLFGPDSAAWQVNGDLAMLVGGVRALFLQTLHPLAMAGVAEHSDYRHDPFGRLRRTGEFLNATTFGSTADAEAAIAGVRRIHDTIVGVAPDGRPYAANDPDLLRWVHVAEVASFVAGHRHYGRQRLDPQRYDEYVAEMAEVARRLGGTDLPTTVARCRDYLREIRPELECGPAARDTIRFLLLPPIPLPTRPAMAVVSAAAVDLLPRWARQMMGFPPTVFGFNHLAVRPAARLVVGTLGWVLGEAPASRGARARLGLDAMAA